MAAVAHVETGSSRASGLARLGIDRARLVRAGTSAAVLLVSLGGILALWKWGSRAYGVPLLFPGPAEVADAFMDDLRKGDITEAVGASLARIVAGFTIGTLTGIVVGLLLGSSRVLCAMTAPLVTFFRFVPPLAWFGVVLVWFGAGESAKIVLIVYTSLFVVALNTMEGVAKVPQDMVRMAGVAGARTWQRLWMIVLPSSVPYIIAGARVAMGNAFMTVVSAEMLGASAGLGVIINNGMTSTAVPQVFAAILILGFLGLGADRLFMLLMNKAGTRLTYGRGEVA